LKVAFDHQIFTQQMYGGISRYYTFLANELLKQDCEVRVLGGLHRNNYLGELPPEIVKGVKLLAYPPKTGRIFQLINHGLSQIHMKFWKPDVIHETYYSSMPIIDTRIARITTVYDMINELFRDEIPNSAKTSALKKATFKRVDHIVSISESTKNDLVNLFGVPEDKISVVHLGVDLAKFQIEHSDKQMNLKPYLLYVGSRAGYKNFFGFLEAFRSSSQLKSNFDVIAFGGGNFTKDEIQLINDFGLSETQIHQYNGNDQVLAKLYANAEVFVYPSLYEGFGLPPLEAMASGCPVVSSNTSSMPEVVRQAGEFFNPKDIDDMREAIERVVFSRQRQMDLVRLGYENIKYFSWEKCAEKTFRVYQKTTGLL